MEYKDKKYETYMQEIVALEKSHNARCIQKILSEYYNNDVDK